ncbi:MarR family winged helix-turn-helix transcriptional regulator [Luteipulveratus mongoliensis]|uniref:MarR family transcriptional regulator n=1 Tax=Luteipulveratus mongoliensis TaxID=571913 RepID=A0A0K1JE76_9MICO|nr:MarR family winged helix-turn-helix transcriptional regulator [Luteipulveratus mongoliensis]AKU14890.1 MarR family transcriptional regulator [Luteipulveratus mongoliensis]
MTDDLSAGERYPVGFAIFGLARTHRALAASMLREMGLFPGQEIMLMQLWDNDGQSQNALGRTLGLDHSTIAKSVKRMADAGLVTRARSTTDGRVTVVSLTDAGRALERRVDAMWARLEELTDAGATAEERAQFVALARKLELNLRADIGPLDC